MKKYIIALDAGTTSLRAMIFDKNKNVIGSCQKEFTQYFPQPGWVEHDPEEIYLTAQTVLTGAINQSGIAANEIEALAISNQRETAVVWDKKTAKPVYNAIVWQCRRTADMCEEIKKAGHSEYIRDKTGLLPDAYFSATKIAWILDNIPGLRDRADKGELAFGTIDSWLLFKFTNGEAHKTDYTNASRTMLFDIHELHWDDKLLKLFGINPLLMPEVQESSSLFGYAEIEGEKIPITGIAGDQQSALFGQGCFNAGEAKNTYGTGCFLLMNTGKQAFVSKNGLVTTLAASGGGRPDYVVEGSVFVGGSVIQWLRDELGLIKTSAESEYFASLANDNAGVYIVPAFTGLGAPHWDMYARGAIFGLTRGSDRNHIIRAALESIAYQSKDVLDAIYLDTNIKLVGLFVDGGASQNDFLMQFQADILGIDVIRPDFIETTALGAAYLAGLTTGFWSIEDIKAHRSTAKHFSPQMPSETVSQNLSGWADSTNRVKTNRAE